MEDPTDVELVGLSDLWRRFRSIWRRPSTREAHEAAEGLTCVRAQSRMRRELDEATEGLSIVLGPNAEHFWRGVDARVH